MWDYKNADPISIRHSLSSVNWARCILHRNPNNQAEFLSNCIKNIFSNHCPNKVVSCHHKDAPWMTSEIKNKLKEKTKIYKKYVKNNYDIVYKQLLNEKMIETSNLIANTKENYDTNEGKKLIDSSLGPKKYWSILNSFLTNKKMSTLPPLFENGESDVDYPTKAETFNNYFVSQCIPLDEGDEVPHLSSKTPHGLSITFSQEKILNIIRALDSNKSSGWDGVSPRMIKICDSSIVNPLLIIFETCIREGIFPDMWKMSNVCPIHKKESKNLKENYRPISLLPILGKMFEKVLFDSLYDYFINNDLLTLLAPGRGSSSLCLDKFYCNAFFSPSFLTIFYDFSRNLFTIIIIIKIVTIIVIFICFYSWIVTS